MPLFGGVAGKTRRVSYSPPAEERLVKPDGCLIPLSRRGGWRSQTGVLFPSRGGVDGAARRGGCSLKQRTREKPPMTPISQIATYKTDSAQCGDWLVFEEIKEPRIYPIRSSRTIIPSIQRRSHLIDQHIGPGRAKHGQA